jgi:hypothetical protein
LGASLEAVMNEQNLPGSQLTIGDLKKLELSFVDELIAEAACVG